MIIVYIGIYYTCSCKNIDMEFAKNSALYIFFFIITFYFITFDTLNRLFKKYKYTTYNAATSYTLCRFRYPYMYIHIQTVLSEKSSIYFYIQ